LHSWRVVAVFACVLALIASTAISSLAAPESEETAGGYTYADMGYDDPNEATEALAQDTAASGQFIADYAMQFLGYPYVYAGNTPGGFDCSGFTQYVILNTLGYDIGHGVAGQTGSGYWVDWGNWQPGDLVYFAGTYRPGISHTGVYIGDGQFIHAENPGTGVVISSLYSDYYSGHYYGAYRHV
jgi:cell wall-associated NlpC family hydrolase